MQIHWSTPAWMWPLLLVLAAGAVVWTVSMYRSTRPLPPPTLRRILNILRSLALVLLVLAIAGPVLVRLKSLREAAQVVVVLEDSASMGSADGSTPPNAGGDSGQTRWDRALNLAVRIDSTLAVSDGPVEIVLLRGNGLEPLAEFHLDDAVIPTPTAHGTDLTRLLGDVAARLVGRPAQAVVLVSDGQETSQLVAGSRGRDRRTGPTAGLPLVLDPTAESLSVAVVGVGDPVGPADRILKDLRYPDTAFAGDEVVVEIAVTHRFTAEQDLAPVTARLKDTTGTVVAETTVPVTAPLTRLELSFVPETEGLQLYQLELSPLVNERFHENNEASLAVNVAKDRARVLLLADRPGWDVRFLAQAAQAEQRLVLDVVYPATDGLVLADSTGQPMLWRSPATAAGWLEHDGVVLTGWTGQLDSLDWTSLTAAVEQGLGLLVLPGAEVSGEAGRSLPPPAQLAELLPVTSTTWRWQRNGFETIPLAASAGHPLRSGQDGAGGVIDAGLNRLPPLRRLVPTEPKPAALVLLNARLQHGDPATPQHPLLVVDVRQQGRVVFFAGRRLWELAFWDPALGSGRDGDPAEQPARRLLRNLLVWTASGEQEAGLALVGRRAFFQEGETIRLAARWRDMRGGAVIDRGLALAVRPADAEVDSTRVRTFKLNWSAVDPGLAELELPLLPAGSYTMQLIGQGEPPVLGREEAMVITAHNVEQTQVRQDRQRLRQLAATAGGSYFNGEAAAGEVDQLLASLGGRTFVGREQAKRSRLDFWSGWPFLSLVVVLLAVEWWLRRRHGLL